MNTQLSYLIIERAGGDTAFARLINLNLDKPGVQQRVHNWKKRGIPAAVVLANYPAIQHLIEAIQQPTDPAATSASGEIQ